MLSLIPIIIDVAIIIACIVTSAALFSSYKRVRYKSLLLFTLAIVILCIAFIMELIGRFLVNSLSLAESLFRLYFFLAVMSFPLIFAWVDLTRAPVLSRRFYIYSIFTAIFATLRATGELGVSVENGIVQRTPSSIMFFDVNIYPILMIFATFWLLAEIIHMSFLQLSTVRNPSKKRAVRLNLFAIAIVFVALIVVNILRLGGMISESMVITAANLFLFISLIILSAVYVKYPYLVYILPQRIHGFVLFTSWGTPIFKTHLEKELESSIPLLSAIISALVKVTETVFAESLRMLQIGNIYAILHIGSKVISCLFTNKVFPIHQRILEQLNNSVETLEISETISNEVREKIKNIVEGTLYPLLP